MFGLTPRIKEMKRGLSMIAMVLLMERMRNLRYNGILTGCSFLANLGWRRNACFCASNTEHKTWS
jgi:hypothetical protein